ncbi:MAG: hypothetical protein NTZ21_06410 [Actinobacteria bacterium]|nr:hypothetical protein [Actinomycetota bacterium]
MRIDPNTVEAIARSAVRYQSAESSDDADTFQEDSTSDSSPADVGNVHRADRQSFR